MKPAICAALWICLLAPSLVRADWFVERSVDPITDHQVCKVKTTDFSDPHLFGFVVNGKLTITVSGGRSYPGATKAIRVDQNPAVQFVGEVTGDEAVALLAQMEAGSIVHTRYAKWPQKTSVDSEGPIGDFPAKLRSCLAPTE